MEPRLKLSSGYTEQTAMDDVHRLYMLTKISHYATLSYAAHKALDDTFESLEGLIDDIAERLIGYTKMNVTHLTIGTVNATTPEAVGREIIKVAANLESYATSKNFPDLENIAQSLSGVGAKLIYLSRLK